MTARPARRIGPAVALLATITLAGCGDAALSSAGAGADGAAPGGSDAGAGRAVAPDSTAPSGPDAAGGDPDDGVPRPDAARGSVPPPSPPSSDPDDGVPPPSPAEPDAAAPPPPPNPDAATPPPPPPGPDAAAPPPPPPPLPPIRPNGFHTVVIADTDRWNDIRAMADAGDGTMLVSDNKPADLPFDRWTRRISASREDTGEALAALLDAELSNPAGAPIKVVVDELRDEYRAKLLAMTREMAARYPQWRGRWGVYLVNGPAVHYANYTEEIDALLSAGAMILAEMYPQATDYCRAGDRVIDRDLWLARFFRGDDTIARLHWLLNRRDHLVSDSHISVVFGVIDRFLEPATPAVFLDRMFYVFMTRSDHPELLSIANGGPGAWKWQAPADGNDNVGNSSRDLAFREAVEHYIVAGNRDSRLGQVDCP